MSELITSSSTSKAYTQAMAYLFSRINYERSVPKGKLEKAFKLERMEHLLRLVGNPQATIPVIHIAGTKGKGSTAVMLAEILQAAGYRTGLFTSPHISQYEERIRVNGQMPTPADMVMLIEETRRVVEKMEQMSQPMVPTFFEMTTTMAWLYFQEQQVDIAVIEVGLGGRLDSTNICNPILTMVTNISFDHTAILGKTLPEIAREKGGIIKKNIPLICGIQNEEPRDVIEQISKQQSAPIIQRGKDFSYTIRPHDEESLHTKSNSPMKSQSIDVQISDRYWKNIPVPLAGKHQAENASLAVAAVDQLNQSEWTISIDAVRLGMQAVQLPARIELMQRDPTIIIDAAHNCASIQQLVETLAEETYQKRALVFATSRDKDVRRMLEILLPAFDTVILTQYLGNPRALAVADLLKLATSIDNRQYQLAKKPTDAWHLAQQFISKSDLLCVTGSFFIAAEMRELVIQD